MDCLFCKIVSGEIESDKIYEDDKIIAFNDINPQAPIHQLIIPKQHIDTINELTKEHAALIGDLVLVAKQLAADANFAEDGYRLILNCNRGGGQMVFHIHLHLLGGRQMMWPPG